MKFSCPHCQQHIEADDAYGGVQINCPTCNGALMIPGVAAPPAPPPPAPVAPSSSLSIQRPAASAAASGCPSCGAALPRGATLCTQCGYNLSTGQRMVAGRVATPGKPTSPQYATPWYKTAYPYMGAVFVLMAILYFLGRENRLMMLGFLIVAALYSLTVQIIVIVAAFQDSVGTGFLTMCIPFYAIYFVFRVHDNDTLKLLYGSAVIINIALRFINFT